jgi:hypothetical protein
VVHVVHTDEATRDLVHRTFSTRDDAWGPAETIGADAKVTTREIKREGNAAIVLDAADEPQVVYTTADGAVVARRRAGGRWLAPRVLDRGDAPLHPQLAADADGRLHLAWLDRSAGPAPRILYRVRGTDGRWSPVEVVAAGDVLTNDNADQGPSIVVDSAGRPHVLYVSALPASAVRVAVRTGAGAWTDESPPGDLFVHTPQIHARGDDLHVFLGHDADINFGVATRPAGAGWTYRVLDAGGSLDGSASVRWDPQRETDARVIDVVYWDEDVRDDRSYLPRLFYMAVLPALIDAPR